MRLALGILVTFVGPLALGGCDHASTASRPVATKRGATLPATIDGLSVGGTMPRAAPYDTPCDRDPLDEEPAIRATIYAGKECHHVRFPDHTSVVALTDKATATIIAFGWMGGTYFDKRSGLPLAVGVPVDQAVDLWGAPVASFDLQTMRVKRFANGLRVMTGRFDQIVGFAFGDLPDAPSARWQAFDHLYGVSTVHVGNPAVTEAECRDVMAHVYDLMDAKGVTVAAQDIEDCHANNTPAKNRCILAATTNDGVARCFEARTI